jgi:hypothetical protein
VNAATTTDLLDVIVTLSRFVDGELAAFDDAFQTP